MRLITQQTPGDWTGVMAEARDMLQNAEVTVEASAPLPTAA
jgi:hypothetical protein